MKWENDRFNTELRIRDSIEKQLNDKITIMKDEILMGKRILKDPNLSHMATRKFNSNIDKFNAHKFLLEGC